jgi:hypothetical protein
MSSYLFDRRFVTLLDLSHVEAMFLHDLIDLSNQYKHFTDRDGYFTCTSNLLKEICDWPDATQKRLLDKLTNRGFIKYKRKGNRPTQRWVIIFPEAITREIADKSKMI